MGSYRKEIQTKLLKYGSLKEIVRKWGVLTIIYFAISNFLDVMSKRFYRLRGTDYGLLETLFHPRGIDRWSRYAYVVNEIKKLETMNKILEVGSGGGGVTSFISQDYEIFLVDVQKDVFQGLKIAHSRMVHSIVGDGCRLPFRDKAFDVVISVDTVEHIPKLIRNNFYNELKRVCKKKVVLTCPMQSNDGIFQGKNYDMAFQYLYERNYGVKEPNTAQHIAAGHPTLEEIKREFSDPEIHGYQKL